MLLGRLDLGPDVREALACTFECWNGKGHPHHVQGDAIPLPMRIVHVSHDMEALGRLFSPERALEAARERRGETYDPAVADLFLAHGRDFFDRLAGIEPWDAVLALEPEPHRLLTGAELDDALTVVADFIDLKSPYWGGHSRRCAQVRRTRPACSGSTRTRRRSGAQRSCTTSAHRRPELDLGQARPAHEVGVRPGRLHPLLTEQMLRRSPALAALSPVACAITRNAMARDTTSESLKTTISARASSRRRRSMSG